MAILKLPYRGKVKLSSPYGNRILNGTPGWHAGVDLVGQDEKIIRAPCDAVVGVSTMIPKEGDTTLTWQWGNYVRLDCAGGMKIFLCHMAERLVHAGESVKTGDALGVEGNTGYSFGSHCHFEVRIANSAIDPTPYLWIRNEIGIYEGDAIPGGSAGTSSGASAAGGTAAEAGKPGDGNTPHDWAVDAVNWGVSVGILKGSSADKLKLRLNDPVTREEMMVFLHRFAEAIDEYLEK